MKGQPVWKTNLAKILSAARFIFHWSYIPFVIYLGFKQGADPGMPELQLTR